MYIIPYFYIRNSQLTTLDFRALQSIRDFFDVQNNSQLTDIDFPSLTSIGTGRTYIYSLGGNTNNVSIAVERNPNLFDCYVLKEFLTGGNHAVSGSIHINDNPTNGGCNSQNEIINSIYTGNITVSTQTAVNNLRSSLAGKTRINGNVTIGYTSGSSRSNIMDLSNFGNIFRITGDITIQQNEELANLNGLNNLRTIGGFFRIHYNEHLTTLDFPALSSIGEHIWIKINEDLTTLNFPVLSSTGHALSLQDNEKLTTLDFSALRSIGAHFEIQENDQLTTLDFPTLTSIGVGVTSVNGAVSQNVSIVVERNPSLSDCYALTEFLPGGDHAVSGSIHINDNPTNSGCNSQNEIINSIYTGDITVKTQTAVNTLRTTLAGKTIINGNLFIGYDDEGDSDGDSRSIITDLTPLSNIVRITGFIGISQNGQLVNLNGLNNLQTIGGDFFVILSDELTTLGDFPNLQSIGRRFYVAGNDKLTTLGDFPALRFIGETFYVILNDELTTLGNFPVLTSIGRGYVISVPSLRSNDGGDEAQTQALW